MRMRVVAVNIHAIPVRLRIESCTTAGSFNPRGVMGRLPFLCCAVLLALPAASAAQQRTTPARATARCTLTSATAPAGQRGAQAARPAAAAAGIPGAAQRATTTGQAVPAGAYDIVVDVPNLCVDSLTINVRNLLAHVALDAQVANLVSISAGADVRIEQVQIRLRDVRAEALLLVDLDDVALIVDDLLTMLDNNPEIVNSLVGVVNTAVGTVGSVANTALQPGGVVGQTVGVVGQTLTNLTQPGGVLSQTVNTLGQTVQRTFNANGDLIERVLDTAGGVLNQRTVGNLLQLTRVSETTNAAGQTVRTVRDTAGSLIELTLDTAGRILGARALQR
jgi:hypothetical protein